MSMRKLEGWDMLIKSDKIWEERLLGTAIINSQMLKKVIEWINTKTSNKNSSDNISDPICYKSLHNERRTTHFMRNIKERAEWRKLCSQINFMWVESFRVEVRVSKIPTSKLISIKSKSITVNLFILSIVRWNEKKKSKWT